MSGCIGDTDYTSSDESEESDVGKLRTCTGLLKSYHGVAYQIQWLMVVAIEAKKCKKVDGFRFRTEVDYNDSGKFDDVVWEYYCVHEKKFKYNFLQAKHKLNEEHDRITINDLKKEKNPFGLKKYYVSYKESIQNNKKYINGLVENLIIATNIDLDDHLKQIFKNSHDHPPLLNDFETDKCRRPKCWKIDSNMKENISSIVDILEETHDLIKLAKMLEDLIFNDKEFTIPKDLQEYSSSIFKNLLTVDYIKISSDFIQNKNLSNETMFLREAFLSVAFVKKRHLYDDGLIETSDSNIEDFAKYFASKIKESQYENKLVKIRLSKNNKNYENYKWNINRLANYILINKNGIKFNPKFWIQNEIEGRTYFYLFKIKLKCKLFECGLINLDDTNEEISVKLDSYRFKITNFTTCMMHLTDENTFWEAVKDYNTRLSTKANQCGVVTKTLPNYSLCKVSENINSFFSILVFAVNFTKTILNEAVEDNFNESFKWIDNEFTAYAFRSEIANALDLTQEKFISNAEDVSQFFNKVEEETNRLILIGPTLEYCTKIKLFDIEFQSDVVNVPNLRFFLNIENIDVQNFKGEQSKIVCEYDNFYRKQILCYLSNQKLLSSIKVYHLLKNTVKYGSEKKYIFMRLESIIYLHEQVLKVFEKSISLLIIECDFDSKFDLRKLSKKIISILRSDTAKKVLLITQGNNYLAKKLKDECYSSYCEIVDPEVHFSNLKEKTQQKLLQNYKINFQGKENSLGDLIKDFKNVVDSQILCQILNNNKIEVCNQLLTKDSIIHFYISREIICHKKLKTEFLKDKSADLYAISNIKINDLMDMAMQYKKSETNIESKISHFRKIDLNNIGNFKFIIVDDDIQYNFLCKANKHSNVHWLVNENNYFKWINTKGSFINLRPYMIPRKYYSEADNEIINELKNDRIVIIAADPGMGKSTLIKHLALKLKDAFPLLWLLVIDLGKYRSELKKIKLNDSESVINFLINVVDFKFLKQIKDEITCRKIIDWFNKRLDTNDFINGINVKGTDLLEMFVFYSKLHKPGEVFIFFDGFDEICPKYEAEVTYIIKILKSNTMANIWTTCRTYNIIDTLEDNLEIVSYGIKCFSENDQELFLLKYWKSKLNVDILDEQRAHNFIRTLLLEFSKATNDAKRTFVGIPLQIQMLAQNRLIMFKEFYESGVLTLSNEDKINIKKGLNLVNLYDEFIDIKFHEIRFKEKKHTWPSDDEDIDQMIKKCRQDFINEHKVLSIYALYAERRELCSDNIKSEALSLLPKIIKADDKNAIISGVIDKNPIFVHQTYAEYFASLFLWNKFQSATLEEFRKHFLPNMLNGIFFSDERLQVCKFFYFMADKYFTDNIQCIYNGKEDVKIAYILQQISDFVYVIYDSCENQGINSKGIDDIIVNKNKWSEEQNIHRVFKQNPQFVQVVKLIFFIVESYLTINKSAKVIKTILKKNNTLHLLRIASEIGCLNFVKTFLSVKDDYNYKKSLKCSKWYFSPVWLAARNGHLDILKQLSLIIDHEWPDKDDKTLAQRAYNLPECDVLQSCLLLNIIDANTYLDLNYIKTLPIVNAFQNVWPLNIIEILIEKTDSDIFNKFVSNHGQKASLAICTSLLKYETSVVSLMIKKGMNFFGVLNCLLFEFNFTSLYGPINSVKYASVYSPSFHSEQEYLRVYGLIETFLHSGVGYNSFDNVHSVTTIDYCKQIHYMHQLFKYFADSIVGNIDGVYLLLKYILNTVAKECEIIKLTNRSLLLRVLPTDFYQQPECGTAKRKRTYTASKCCYKIWPNSYYNGIAIQLLPLSEKYISYPNKEIIENSLSNITTYMQEASKEIKEFKEYPDSKLYNNIFIGYEEMLEYRFRYDVSKNILFKSLSGFERHIFQCILNLYIRQDYDILEAFNEVSRNIWRYIIIEKWLQEKPKDCKILFEEVIKIFGLDEGHGTNESIVMQYQISKIIMHIFDSGALERLLNVWNELNYVGEKLFEKVVKSMSKYEGISTKIFDLFNKLDAYYVWLIDSIKSKKLQNLLDVLKHIDSAFVKSVVNAQDSIHGSPLHYAVFLGNVEMVRILLTHSADPNQELESNSKLLSDSDECCGKSPKDIAQAREHLNPEVYGTIIGILSDLRIRSTNDSTLI